MRKRDVGVLALLTAAVVVGCAGCGREDDQVRAAVPRKASRPPTETMDVAALQARADKLEAEAKRSPGDASVKESAAQADYEAGHAMMVSDKLDRKEKYRGALRYFRRALALDPNQKMAAEEKDLIESIYRQMGRPVPE